MFEEAFLLETRILTFRLARFLREEGENLGSALSVLATVGDLRATTPDGLARGILLLRIGDCFFRKLRVIIFQETTSKHRAQNSQDPHPQHSPIAENFSVGLKTEKRLFQATLPTSDYF